MRDSIGTVAKNLGLLRSQVHQKHHHALDSNVAFLRVLIRELEHLEKQMAQVKQALDKRTAERDAWKAYAQSRDAAVTDAQAKEKTAEDALAAIPIVTDADDKAAVDAVLAAPDDLPPAETPVTPQ
jgi:peptidoglycan hydrolase CwlO-like protein